MALGKRVRIPDGMRLGHATSLEEVESLRTIWEAMQSHPNSDIDHYLNVLNTFPNIVRPHVTVVYRGKSPIALMVGRIENFVFNIRFGGLKLYSPAVRTLTVIYGGLLGELTDESCAAMFYDICAVLSTGEADLVRMHYLDTSSRMYELASSAPVTVCKDHFPSAVRHWRMQLPASMEGFWKSRSSKHRYWLKRMERLLEKDHTGNIRYVFYGTEADMDILFRDAELVAKATYQRKLGVGFRDNEESRKIYGFLARKGRLMASVAYVDSRPCSYWIGEKYGEACYLYSTGYDPLYKNYEIGTVLLVKIFERLCELGTVRYVDFGFGDAFYKKRFGDEVWNEATIHVFSSRATGLKVNAAYTFVTATYALLRRTLDSSGLLRKMKRQRRNRLQGNENEGSRMVPKKGKAL